MFMLDDLEQAHSGFIIPSDDDELEETTAEQDVEDQAEDDNDNTEVESESDNQNKPDDNHSEKDGGDTDTTDKNDGDWTKAAVLDERRKRQERDQKIEELQAEIESYKKASNLPLKEENPEREESKDSIPDPVDNPEAYHSYMLKRQDHELFLFRQEIDQNSLSEKHDDYDEMISHFKTMASNSPAIYEEYISSRLPATYAYNAAKKDLNAKKFSDPQYEAKLKEEIRNQVMSELGKESDGSEKPSKKSNSTMPDLNSVASSGNLGKGQATESDLNDFGSFFNHKY